MRRIAIKVAKSNEAPEAAAGCEFMSAPLADDVRAATLEV